MQVSRQSCSDPTQRHHGCSEPRQRLSKLLESESMAALQRDRSRGSEAFTPRDAHLALLPDVHGAHHATHVLLPAPKPEHGLVSGPQLPNPSRVAHHLQLLNRNSLHPSLRQLLRPLHAPHHGQRARHLHAAAHRDRPGAHHGGDGGGRGGGNQALTSGHRTWPCGKLRSSRAHERVLAPPAVHDLWRCGGVCYHWADWVFL